MSPTPFQSDQPHGNHHSPHPDKGDTTVIVTTDNNDNKNINTYGGMSCPSSLKIHRDSHAIKKLSSPNTSSSSASVSSFAAPRIKSLHHNHQQHRGPVIIYTHSPKVIHTNPRDFMSLVQKLTGMSSSDEGERPVDQSTGPPIYDKIGSCGPHMSISGLKRIAQGLGNDNNNNTTKNSSNNDDNESSSVITDENCSSSTTGDDVVQLNSGVGLALFDQAMMPPPLDPAFSSLPLYSISNSSSFDLLCPGPDPPLCDYIDFNLPYNHMS